MTHLQNSSTAAPSQAHSQSDRTIASLDAKLEENAASLLIYGGITEINGWESRHAAVGACLQSAQKVLMVAIKR